MPSPEVEIIEALIQYQRRKRWTDKQMGEAMGIPGTTWCLFRHGRHIPRTGVLAGFARLFPRRMGLVRAFLVGELAEASEVGENDDAA